MSITPSSFTVLIRPNLSNIYRDNNYRVITYSSSAPRRYGTYTPTSNVFIFAASPQNLVDDFQSNTAIGLAPDTQYYLTAETNNKLNSLYGRPVDSRSNIDSNLWYKRTTLPDPPNYINNVSIINSTPNIFPSVGIPANSNTNGFTVSNIYNISAGNLFTINSALGVHTSNNTGSTLPAIMSNIIQVNGINDITASVGGFTQSSNTITASGSNIQLNISNISDKYNSSNYTGFYRTFNTSFSLVGDCSQDPVNIRYIQQGSNFIRSNTLLPFYRDNLDSMPTISCGEANFTSIITPEVTYITGVPSYNSNITLDGIQIASLYKNFIAPGNVIEIKLSAVSFESLLPFTYTIESRLTMSASNLIIYDIGDNLINISTQYPLPSPIKLNNINLNLDNRLYTLNLTTEPIFTLNATNILGTGQFSDYLVLILGADRYIYWDLPSIRVVNNTSITSYINSNSGYGLRVTAGYDGAANGFPKDEYYADYFGNLISFNRYIFDNTVNLLSNEEYNYELPLFGGYFQTSNFKMDASLITTYIDYRMFNNSYLSDREITYPDYRGLVENVTNPNMCFRYICFKYTVNPKAIVNRGLCMIQFINNNFTMDPSTYIIGEHLDEPYYNNYLIKYKIITLDSTLETAWLSLQAVTPASINFTENYFYDGALTNEAFISDDKTEYKQSATNRIFVIPPGIENVGFDMYIRLGIPKGDRAGFQYISTCFNRV
jgi:hypothetical protein